MLMPIRECIWVQSLKRNNCKYLNIFVHCIHVLPSAVTFAWLFGLLLHTNWSWNCTEPDTDATPMKMMMVLWVHTLIFQHIVYLVHVSSHPASCARKSVHSTAVINSAQHTSTINVPCRWLCDSLLIRVAGSMSNTSQRAQARSSVS